VNDAFKTKGFFSSKFIGETMILINGLSVDSCFFMNLEK